MLAKYLVMLSTNSRSAKSNPANISAIGAGPFNWTPQFPSKLDITPRSLTTAYKHPYKTWTKARVEEFSERIDFFICFYLYRFIILICIHLSLIDLFFKTNA